MQISYKWTVRPESTAACAEQYRVSIMTHRLPDVLPVHAATVGGA